MMEQLMNPDPKKRLGAKGIDEIKQHPFFAKTNWDTLMTEPAPWIPYIGNDEDAYYFPKKGENDEDIKHIIEDQAKCSKIHADPAGNHFKNFEETCYELLGDYNHLAA